MSSLGSGEIIVLVVVIIIVFSASRMGQLGNAVGRFVYNFKKASKGHELVDSTAKRARGSEPGEVIDEKK